MTATKLRHKMDQIIMRANENSMTHIFGIFCLLIPFYWNAPISFIHVRLLRPGGEVSLFYHHVASLAKAIILSQMSILPFLWIWLVHKTPEGLEIPVDFREPVVTSLSGPSWQTSDITLARWQVKGLLGISVFLRLSLVLYFLTAQTKVRPYLMHTTVLWLYFHTVPGPRQRKDTANQLRGFINDCISCNIASGLHQNLILQIMLRKWDFGRLKINKAVYGLDVGIGLIRHWKMVIVWNVITVIKIHRHERGS